MTYLDAALTPAREVELVLERLSDATPGVSSGAFVIGVGFELYSVSMRKSTDGGPVFDRFSTPEVSGRRAPALIVRPGIAGFAGLTVDRAFVTLNASNILAFVSEASVLSIVP